MRTSDDLVLLISSGLVALSLVAIVAILATARGAYAMPIVDNSATFAAKSEAHSVILTRQAN